MPTFLFHGRKKSGRRSTASFVPDSWMPSGHAWCPKRQTCRQRRLADGKAPDCHILVTQKVLTPVTFWHTISSWLTYFPGPSSSRSSAPLPRGARFARPSGCSASTARGARGTRDIETAWARALRVFGRIDLGCARSLSSAHARLRLHPRRRRPMHRVRRLAHGRVPPLHGPRVSRRRVPRCQRLSAASAESCSRPR
jgi:hypothetical protein